MNHLIGIRYGLKGNNRKLSTFSHQTDVIGLSVSTDNLVQGGYFGHLVWTSNAKHPRRI